MKRTIRRAVVWLMICVLTLGCTGCGMTGTIYGKPLDDMEEVDTAQGILFGTKIMEIMAEGTLDDLNQLGYHYGKEDAESFEDFWADWEAYRPIYGQILSIELEEDYLYGSELVFVFKAAMENGDMQIAAMFTDDFEMVMLFLYETAETVLENTVIPEGVVEEEITVGEGTEYPLAGKITYPEGAKAGDDLKAVVLVAGDGANTMDVKAGNSYLFRDLAWGLAEQGIVTIRFDERSLTYVDELSDVDAPVDVFNVDWEYTEDVLRATQMLRDLEFVDDEQVYYVGHSEGGTFAPRIDEEGGDYAGYVLLSTSPRACYDVVYDQYINYGLVDQESETLYYLVSKIDMERDYLKDGDYEDAEGDDLTSDLIFRHPAAYWQDYFSYDYVEGLKNQQKPTLILHGEADYKMKVDVDFAAWQEELEGASYATLKSYEGLNHWFMESTGVFAGHYKEHDMPELASEEVIQDIGSWVLNGGTLSD